VGKPAGIQRVPIQPGDLNRTCADLSRSRAHRGFNPSVGLSEGPRCFVDWFREVSGPISPPAG
jgi:UDP-glucuronate 4-epimerase